MGGVIRHRVLGKVGGVVGTWSRKPHIIFCDTIDFNYCFGKFSTKHGICYIFYSCFQ
jgi:hypothetical protein